ncbi:arginine--tRNA ligase [Ranunculus cassubicifolius]
MTVTSSLSSFPLSLSPASIVSTYLRRSATPSATGFLRRTSIRLSYSTTSKPSLITSMEEDHIGSLKQVLSKLLELSLQATIPDGVFER